MLRLHGRQGKRFAQTDGYEAYYAGAEANACVLLSRLGIGVDYVTVLPDNEIAMAGVRQLRAQGVGTDHIVYRGEKLGVYFTEQGNAIRPTRVIYDREGSSYAKTGPGVIDWRSCLEGVSYFHWSGIAAAVSAPSADASAEVLAIAREKGVRISA